MEKIQLRDLHTPRSLQYALDNFNIGDSLKGGFFCSRHPHRVYGVNEQDKINVYCRSYNKSLHTFNSKDVCHSRVLLTEKDIMTHIKKS
jgi:hypothetical protein